MRLLQVIRSGFRTLVEEQDDTIIWLCENLHSAGADISILLRGHASYYAVQSEPQPLVQIGNWTQTQPADLTRDIANLSDFNVPIYAVKEDLEERSLMNRKPLPGIDIISQKDLPFVYERFDHIWQW